MQVDLKRIRIGTELAKGNGMDVQVSPDTMLAILDELEDCHRRMKLTKESLADMRESLHD